VYLSSQDDPEVELCHNPSSEAPAKLTRKLSDKRGKQDGLNNTSEHAGGPKLDFRTDVSPSGSGAQKTHQTAGHNGTNTINQPAFEDILEEPTTVDHKSFIQNVYNTVAFKVVEWLAPRNFTSPTITGDDLQTDEGCSPSLSQQEPGRGEVDTSAGLAETNHRDNELPKDNHEASHSPGLIARNIIPNRDSQDLKPTTPNDNAALPRQSSSTIRGKIPTCNPHLPKEVVNTSTMVTPLDKKHITRDLRPSQEVHRLSKKEIPSSPRNDITFQVPGPHSTSEPAVPANSSEITDIVPKPRTVKVTKDKRQLQNAQSKDLQKKIIPGPCENIRLPQSLSHMTIEVIDLIYNVLQADGTSEKHFLYPQRIDKHFKHRQGNGIALARHSLSPALSTYPLSLRNQWQLFIEQTVFDVLHKPESLLQSFSQNEDALWDSQSLWYAMLLMTRATPSLVFHALWIALGTTFLPPDEVISKSDVKKESFENSKEPTCSSSRTRGAISDINAARVVSICLHTLVAAAPVVSKERQLGNMSRIRSKGLVMDDLESPSLCLQYEDAFTDDLALRLARRVFGVIPTRQSFAESKRHQQAAYGSKSCDLDIIKIILETMKTPELGTPPLFHFSDSESRLHEKRVPFLVLDWARTVLIHEWDGAAEILTDGPSGGALAMIAALCMIFRLSFKTLLT